MNGAPALDCRSNHRNRFYRIGSLLPWGGIALFVESSQGTVQPEDSRTAIHGYILAGKPR